MHSNYLRAIEANTARIAMNTQAIERLKPQIVIEDNGADIKEIVKRKINEERAQGLSI